MAHSISAKKRIRQNLKARSRNRARKDMIKLEVKSFTSALASGDQGSRPSPSAWQAGPTSHSIARASRLYCGWTVTGRISSCASARSTYFWT